MKTETIISPLRKKKWGLPSHSVYKCRSMPVIPTFTSEVSIQILIEIKRSRDRGQFQLRFSSKGLTFTVVSP